jgi:ankyrin repeat protein
MGHIDIVPVLISAPGIDVNKKDTQGFTALAVAKQCGHSDIATLLVQAGAR